MKFGLVTLDDNLTQKLFKIENDCNMLRHMLNILKMKIMNLCVKICVIFNVYWEFIFFKYMWLTRVLKVHVNMTHSK